MRPNRPYQSKSFENKRQKRTTTSIIVVVILLVSWGFAFSQLSYLSYFQIENVRVYGATADVTGSLESAVMNTLDGSYLGLFSRANTFIYPKDLIAGVLVSSSSVFDTVNIKRDGWNSLTVSVSEKNPDAMVCKDLPDLGSFEISTSSPTSILNCSMVDLDGRVLRAARFDDVGKYNRYYVVNISSLKSIQSFVDTIKSSGIEVVSTLVKEGGAYEVYAKNPSSQSIVVIQATESASLPIEAENLILFWRKVTSEAKANMIPVEWNELKLQYPPNVYYTENK